LVLLCRWKEVFGEIFPIKDIKEGDKHVGASVSLHSAITALLDSHDVGNAIMKSHEILTSVVKLGIDGTKKGAGGYVMVGTQLMVPISNRSPSKLYSRKILLESEVQKFVLRVQKFHDEQKSTIKAEAALEKRTEQLEIVQQKIRETRDSLQRDIEASLAKAKEVPEATVFQSTSLDFTPSELPGNEDSWKVCEVVSTYVFFIVFFFSFSLLLHTGPFLLSG
jgi:hypothetical protein